MVVGDVLKGQARGVPCAKDDHMVEEFSPGSQDSAFGVGILPGRPVRCPAWAGADRLDELNHRDAEDGVPVEDEDPRRGVEREGLAQLLDHPLGGRVVGCGELQDVSPSVVDDKEAVKLSEPHGGNGEEVHGRSGVHVVAQECEPTLSGSGSRWAARHVSRHRGLRDDEAELDQLCMNPRCTPAIFDYEVCPRATGCAEAANDEFEQVHGDADHDREHGAITCWIASSREPMVKMGEPEWWFVNA